MQIQTYEPLTIGQAEGDTSPGTPSPALYGVSIGLYGAQINITPSNSKAEFDAASMSFGGYLPHAVVWGAVSRGGDGAIQVLGSVSPWIPTGTDTTQLAWGFYMYGADDQLRQAGEFDNAPIDMSSTLSVIQLIPAHKPNASEQVIVIT